MTLVMIKLNADNCHGRAGAGDVQQHIPKTTGNFDLSILYFYIKILHFAFLILYQNLCIFTLTTISSTSQKMNATLQYDERFLNLPVLIEQIVLQSVK